MTLPCPHQVPNAEEGRSLEVLAVIIRHSELKHKAKLCFCSHYPCKRAAAGTPHEILHLTIRNFIPCPCLGKFSSL